MAYFNGYPATYQPVLQQPAQPQSTGIIWVQGEQAAKSYLVAPGGTVQLWDSEEKVIYLKSADASGMPSMKILDYTIRGEAPAVEYATKADLQELAEKIRIFEQAGKRRRLMEDADDE